MPSFSQEIIHANLSPSKIKQDISLVCEKDGVVIHEHYHYWKWVVWFSRIDTLKKVNGQYIRRSGDTIHMSTFSVSIDECDSVISRIRNDALEYRVNSDLCKKCERLIGNDNRVYRMLIGSKSYSKVNRSQCHKDFRLKHKDFEKEKVAEIEQEWSMKLNRLKWLKENSEKPDQAYIFEFLKNMSNCGIDQKALSLIIKSKPDDFLMAIKKLSDLEFHSLKLNIFPLYTDINTNELILQLKNSKIRSSRKGKLIRGFGKKPGKQWKDRISECEFRDE